LHLGNYVQIVTLKRLSLAGHKAYAIIGGATGLIGDPSGKKVERTMLDMNKVHNNIKAIEAQLRHYAGAEVINNADIYKDLTIFDFLRNIGKLINVNYLLEKDVIKNRLESGISYTEFSYALIQGYDFA
jgi:tyrosyl-tRNA synthetase